MAEPKVGMRFSSYYEMQERYRKTSSEKNEEQNFGDYFHRGYIRNTKYTNKAGKVIAKSSFKHDPYTKKKSSTFTTSCFTYEGYARIYDGDIRYSRINGSTSYAIDLNHNGIVDKGEIFPNNK